MALAVASFHAFVGSFPWRWKHVKQWMDRHEQDQFTFVKRRTRVRIGTEELPGFFSYGVNPLASPVCNVRCAPLLVKY